jgi:ribosome-associated protein YbcJ (S4-like RNA binding protein)
MATTRLTGTLIKSGSIPVTALGGGVVTSSAQVAGLIPGGTVSSSAQYPGWVTASSQIDYNSITNKLSGVVSSSTQVQPLLPGGTVSASNQVDITATTNYGTFSSSLSTVNAIQQVSLDALNSATSSYAINATIQSQLAGVASSSSQVKEYLPLGTISASNQIDITATTNYPTFSSSVATKNDTQDISINALNAATSSYALQTQLAGVASSSTQVKTYLPTDTVSSSTQVVAFLPTDTVSSSAQYPGWVTSSTQITQALPTGTISSSAQYPGWVTASSQIDYNSIQNKLSGVLSSSEQVKPLLPANTVSSSTQVINNIQNQIISPTTVYAVTIDATTISGSTVSGSFVGDGSGLTNIGAAGLPGGVVSASSQYPGWVTASSQIDYNSIQNKLSGVVSSSTQVQPLLPNGTVSSSGQVSITATSGYSTFSSSIATKNDTQDVSINALNAATSSYAINSTIQSQLAGVVSSSTQVQPLLPGGTVSSSTQVQPLLPGGTVSSSGQVDVTATTGYSTFSSSIATKNDTQDISINALNAATSSYAINSTIQSQLAGVASSSSQVKAYLPNGTVSSSGQVDITTTTGYTAFSSSIATKNDVQDVSISALNAATSSYAINATIQSQLAGVASSSAQVKAYLPDGTVSSSGQVDYNSITNKLSGVYSSSAFTSPSQGTARLTLNGTALTDVDLGVQTTDQVTFAGVTSSLFGTASLATNVLTANVVSSSAQVATFLPAGTVSSSGQVSITSTTGYSTFSSSIATKNDTQDISITALNAATSSYAINATIQSQLAGVASSSAQVKAYLPGGTVSSSAQYPGWVTSSTQVLLNTVTGTTFSNNSFYFPLDLRVEGNLTAQQIYTEYVSSSVIYESGSSKFGDTTDDVMSVTGSILVLGGRISGSMTGMFSASSQVDYNSITNKLSDVVSSSAQVQPLLPGGTVSSSVQYPGWVTASSQIDYNSITNKLSGVYSSSTQAVAAIAAQTIAPTTVNATSILSGSVLQTGTNALIGGKLAVTGAAEITGTITASNLTANQAVFTNASDGLVSNAITGTGNVVMSASPTLTGTITAASITATGTMLLAGIVSQSSQIDYNSITNKLSGVVSSSTQVQPLLPGGTVSSSGQVDITATTNYATFSSSIATKNNTQDISINALNAATSSYAINATIQSQLAGVISSSAQTVASIANQTIAPTTVNATTINASVVTASALTANQAVFTNASDGLVSNAITGTGNVVMSASPTLTGTITAASITATGTMLLAGIVSQSSQIDYNSITNKLSGVHSSSAFSAPSQGTARLTFNGVALTDVDLGLQADDRPLFSGSQFSGIVSGSGTQYRLVVPVGTNFYAT